MTSIHLFIATVIFAVLLVAAVTTNHFRENKFADAAIAPLVILVMVSLVCAGGLLDREDKVARRVTLEEHYGVDIAADRVSKGADQGLVIDGDLYTCEVRESGDGVQMFCDEPPRPEFEKKD